MKKHFFSLVLAALMLAGSLRTSAWGPTGHRVTAEIASFYLTAKAKLAISRIIGNESLAMIANWPDFIKSDTTDKYKHTSSWHYLDFPGHISRQEFDRLLGEAKGENLYSQTLAMIKELKTASTTPERKRFALAFLVHMIGDMHQPLHVGRDEDMGGNKIQLSWFDRPTNLHKVWDEYLIDFQQYSYTEYSNILNRVVTASAAKSMQSGSIPDWMWQSHVLSDKVYAGSPEGAKLSYSYNYVFVEDLNAQLLKGGLRLARILNDTFK
ncbi:S1/P1 nuclease [Chitinophaga barathri]|uniref:S1/P1 Nuclease n=1 Tax=Chitinophaga barathri TaxID=1647451 RepID=A0A3N4MA58_9BACT|nr:S1/P1 nuclease [Chitinophaga barathri]RPD40338.1 S1/P1 Nuclease [Chitinophaga barathri]